MSINVTIEGLAPTIRVLKDFPSEIDGIVRPALRAGGAMLFGAQRRAVHKVTRKLAQSIGMTEQGHGAQMTVTVGLQPGLGTPRGYTKSQTQTWQKPRDGVNRGDPQDYGKFEEARHPFFVKTYADERDAIRLTILERAAAEAQKRLRTA